MAWDDDFQGDWRNPTSLSSDNDYEDVDESYEDELAIDPLATIDKSKDDNIVINIGSVPPRRTLDCVSNNQPPPGARNKKIQRRNRYWYNNGNEKSVSFFRQHQHTAYKHSINENMPYDTTISQTPICHKS